MDIAAFGTGLISESAIDQTGKDSIRSAIETVVADRPRPATSSSIQLTPNPVHTLRPIALVPLCARYVRSCSKSGAKGKHFAFVTISALSRCSK